MHPRNGIQIARFVNFAGVIALAAGWLLTSCAGRQSDPEIEYLSVTPVSSSLALGSTAQFKVFAMNSRGVSKDVTETTALQVLDLNVATVNSSGLVKSMATGKTMLVAKLSGIQGVASIVVSKAALTKITIAAPPSSIVLGQNAQLRATGTYTDATIQDITNLVTWSAAQPTVIAVSPTGMAAAEAVGSTEVTASLNGISASSQIFASPAALVSIAVGVSHTTLPLGGTEQLMAIGYYTDGSTMDLTSAATWSSSSPGVVAVSNAGAVSTKAAGASVVSASVSGIAGTASLTVSSAAMVSIAVNTSQQSLPLGSGEQLTAIATFTDGSTRDLTSSATWISSSPGVITVSNAGAVTAKSVGAAVISASYSNITGNVNLSASNAALVSIAVSISSPSLPLGNSEQLTATGSYTDGSTKNLTSSAIWSSSSPSVITISNTGSVTAKSLGNSVISASSSGVAGSISGSANLSASNAALVSIAVSAGNPSLPLGNSEQLTATGTYTDGSTKNLTSSATWSSSSPGVVAVSSSGAVTTKGVGNAVVSASSSTLVGTTKVAVSAAALLAINISSASTTVPVGNKIQLIAIGSFTDKSSKDLSSSVTWVSSSPGVLSIANSGAAAGVSVGTANVAASSGSVSAAVSLIVSAPALSTLSLVPAGPTLPLGGTLQLSVTGTFSDGSTQDVTQQVTWNLDNATIASISATGLVSGLQIGTSGIEASLNGVQVSDVLTVQPLFTISYFDATSGADSTIRVTNPAITGQDLCAMVYVFDQDQQMSECCGCSISQDGLLTLSLNKNLLNNPLTGVKSKTGTVLLIAADESSNTSCNASSITPAGMVIAWATHLPQSASGLMSSLEEPLSNSALSPTLSAALQAQCSFVQQLGSGQGVCSCGNQP